MSSCPDFRVHDAPAGERRLVITADDLGRDAAGTDTILSLWEDGAVTATSFIVVSPHAEAIAERLRADGRTPHLHITLSSETDIAPWAPLSGGASLLDEHGTLPADPRRAEQRADPDEVRAELDAQLAWMHDRGLHPRAADSHASVLYGIHGGRLLETALHWCADHGLGFRMPRHLDPFPRSGAFPPEALAGHRTAVALADALGVPLPAALLTNPLGAAELGDPARLAELLIAQLPALPPGTSELVLHPSADGPGVPAVRTWEAQLARDPRFRDVLEQAGLRTVRAW